MTFDDLENLIEVLLFDAFNKEITWHLNGRLQQL